MASSSITARSTPAHAGNTAAGYAIYTLPQVYPRPRGEYSRRRGGCGLDQGLPPPTRGILQIILDANVLDGSTPAHAGNTFA